MWDIKDGLLGPRFYWGISSQFIKQKIDSEADALAQIKFLRTKIK